MPFTTSQATNILKSVIPSTTYIGLSTTTPTAAGGNFSEPDPATTGYARAKFGDQDTSKSAQIANAAIIFFNETLAAYGEVTHFGLFSSASADTPFFIGELNPSVTIDDKEYVPIFRKHQLIIGLDKDVLDTNY